MSAGPDSTSICLMGHGLHFPERFKLAPGVFVDPAPLRHDLDTIAAGSGSFIEYAAIVSMQNMVTFGIEVMHDLGGEHLTRLAWNSLWDFSLLKSRKCRAMFVTLLCFQRFKAIVCYLDTYDDCSPTQYNSNGTSKSRPMGI